MHFVSFLKNKHLENHTHFTCLIKGIVLGQASWGCWYLPHK